MRGIGRPETDMEVDSPLRADSDEDNVFGESYYARRDAEREVARYTHSDVSSLSAARLEYNHRVGRDWAERVPGHSRIQVEVTVETVTEVRDRDERRPPTRRGRPVEV